MTPAQLQAVWQRSRCLFDQAAVEAALDTMATRIEEKLADSNPILMCIMHGGLITTE